ncbi:hypothetical protein BDR07DRAFT_1486440 [Suillus spraguei]|nr:hypothetical protein BDR07DRAFT_1486440 [Suillus spraguei]
MSVKYPLSDPVVLHNIQRSVEERNALCKMNITLAPIIREGILGVMFENGDRYYPISRLCSNTFYAVHHQWLKYVEMVTKYAIEVDGGRVDPKYLQLYTSMVAYLKDVMFAFKEETDASGNNDLIGLQRSARLDFHYALALSGQTFTESNRRKMEKKFKVRWEDFITGVNIPELAKLADPSAIHALLCGDDENFCGLGSVNHTEASLTMIDRHIKNSIASWCASKNSVLHGKTLPASGPAGLEKAKQVNDGLSEKGDGQRTVDTARPTTRSEKLVIKLPAIAKKKDSRQEDTVTGTRDRMRKKKSVKQLRTLKILTEKDEGIGAPPVEMVTSSSKKHTKKASEGRPYVPKDGQKQSRTRVINEGGKRRPQNSFVQSSPVQPERTGGKVDEFINASVQGTSRSVTQRAGQVDENVMSGDSASSSISGTRTHSSDKELLRRAMLFADGTTIANNMLIWFVKQYRCVTGTPLDEDFNGRLVSCSPDEANSIDRDSYLEALGLERLYVALSHMHDSPYHLVHLFHALGKAALETNLLSNSSTRVDAVEPLPWVRSRRLEDSDNNNMVPLLNINMESLDENQACDDGPERATHSMVVDKDINYDTEKDAQAVRPDPLLVNTNHSTIKDLETICEDGEVERKRKRAESCARSSQKAEGGSGPSKRSKAVVERRSIRQSRPPSRPKPGPMSVQMSRQVFTGSRDVSKRNTEVTTAKFPPAPQSMQDEPGSSVNMMAQVEVSMSSLRVQGTSNSTGVDHIPIMAEAEASGIAHGSISGGPSDSETKAWFEQWRE